MMARILQGNVFDLLPTLEKGSVDCCVTSPPYWALRSYLPKGHPLKHLELGSEPTPGEFVANLVRVFGLVRECLADHGTVWMNIGDSYSGSSGGGGGTKGSRLAGTSNRASQPDRIGDPYRGLNAGNLCLIPQRLAIALQDDGWLVRSVVVWHKPAPMPASLSGWSWRRCRVKVGGDRGSRDVKATVNAQRAVASFKDERSDSGKALSAEGRATYEDCPGCPKCEKTDGLVLRRGSWRPTSAWEPILMLAKSQNYFADGEPVKTPAAAATVSRDQYTRVLDDPDEQFAVRHDHETECLSGANARDVQVWASEPLKEKHYAAFPSALVRFCLLAGTSAKGYCPACGKPWVRVLAATASLRRPSPRGLEKRAAGLRTAPDGEELEPATTETLGWRPSCSCNAGEPRPGLVLDPFSGSGRTALTARALGLDFVGCELSPEYADMSRRLLTEDAPLFAREVTPDGGCDCPHGAAGV